MATWTGKAACLKRRIFSAKQDYQRAYNSYKRAQIQVQAAQSRLSAFGAVNASNGRYILKAHNFRIWNNKFKPELI